MRAKGHRPTIAIDRDVIDREQVQGRVLPACSFATVLRSMRSPAGLKRFCRVQAATSSALATRAFSGFSASGPVFLYRLLTLVPVGPALGNALRRLLSGRCIRFFHIPSSVCVPCIQVAMVPTDAIIAMIPRGIGCLPIDAGTLREFLASVAAHLLLLTTTRGRGSPGMLLQSLNKESELHSTWRLCSSDLTIDWSTSRASWIPVSHNLAGYSDGIAGTGASAPKTRPAPAAAPRA